MNAIYLYRVARWLHLKRVPILPKAIKYLIFLIFNSVVPYTCSVGARSKLAYGGIGVVIHSDAVIGGRVLIGQGVTIGRKLSPNGVPVIGDDVYIATGAKILGDINIGNNVIIGANSVVISDVPDNSIVVGIPGRVVKKVSMSIYELLENIY